MPKIKQLTFTHTIGDNNQFGMHAVAQVGSERKEFECHSLLGNFAKYLYAALSTGADKTHIRVYGYGTIAITNTTAASPPVITTNSSHNLNNCDKVVITGNTGSYVNLNGTFYVRVPGSNILELYTDEDLTTPAPAPAASGDPPGSIIEAWGRFIAGSSDCMYFDGSTGGLNAGNDALGLIVGTGTTAVNIDDQVLATQILHGTTSGKLSYGAVTVTAPSGDSCTISRTFTNNSGGTIVVNEFGILAYFTRWDTKSGLSGTGRALVSRDVVAGGISVASGKTLTLTVTIKAASDPTSGGFNNNMIKALGRQFGHASVTSTDTSNVSRSFSNIAWPMFIPRGGGKNEITNNSSSTIIPYSVWSATAGIVLGTGSTAPNAASDYNLATPIKHGSADGQLYVYACSVSELTIDTLANTAYFDVIRFFENKGSTSITVKEVGLIAMGNGYYLLTRLVDSSGYITIAAGDFIKVTERMLLQV